MLPQVAILHHSLTIKSGDYMKDFSYDNIEKASEEAFRMQHSSKFFDEDFEKFKCNCRFEKNRENPPLPQNGKTCQNNLLGMDDDKMLILALILILSKNSNDKLLMMALLYIMM